MLDTHIHIPGHYFALQNKSLSTTVASLQLAASQAVDCVVAGLRGKVAHLEGLLKARDKEAERMRWVVKALVHIVTEEAGSAS
jgi:hypothetical protein